MSSAGQQLVGGRIPDERIATAPITSDSVGFTGSPTTIASVVAPVVAGRTYRVTIDIRLEITVTGEVRVGIHEDDAVGNRMQIADVNILDTETVFPVRMEAEFTASVNENKTFVTAGTVNSGGGTGSINAGGNFPSIMYVDYIRG